MDVGTQNITIEVLPPPLLTVSASTVTPAPLDAVVGGPKGDDGYTPVKNVDYFDGTNGVDGADGREVELQNNGTYIQWRYVGGSWSDLVALASLRGTDGVDGQEVSLQVSGGYIQWRLGTGSWTNLIALSALTGADGREVEMRNSGTYIQWRYVGDPTWIDIVALSTLKGDKGDTGVSVPTGGTSGQQLVKNSSTDYDYSWQTPTNSTYTSITGATIATTTATVTLTVDRYQIMNYSSGKLTATLPASASVGSVIEVFGLSSGGFRVVAPSGDNIIYPDGTNSGSAGYVDAPQYATVTLRCVVASTTWVVTKATLLITNNNGKTMPNPQSW